MKHLKMYEEYTTNLYENVNEGKHGRFEIYGRINGEEKIIGYATTQEMADDLKADFGNELDEVWWVDTCGDLKDYVDEFEFQDGGTW